MKKRILWGICVSVVALSVLFILLYFGKAPAKQPDPAAEIKPKLIEIYFDEDGYSIDAFEKFNGENDDGYTALRCEGDRIDKNALALIGSETLKQFTAIASAPDEIKESEIQSAIRKIRGSDVFVGLQGFRIKNGTFDNAAISQISLIDCDIDEMNIGSTSDLSLTGCRGARWEKFRAFTSLETLYIDMAKEEWPEDLNTLLTIPNLRGVTFVVHPDDPGSEEDRKEVLLTRETLDDLKTAAASLPYEYTDIRQFLDDGQRKIRILYEDKVM